MTSSMDLTELNSSSEAEFRVNLLDLLLIAAERKTFILRCTLVAMLLASVIVFLLKNNYSSTAVILPPRQDQPTAMLLAGQLGALSSLGGMSGVASGGLSLKNPNDIYAGLLKSRTVTTYLVDHFNLKQVYKSKTTADAIKSLLAHTKIDLGKDNLISITVTSHDPDFSSQLANAYVDQLHSLNTSLALTDSSQKRLFYQEQLEHELTLLAQAETDLREVQQKTGVLQPTEQAGLVIRNIATIRALLTNRQAELQSMRAFASENNPEYVRVREQVASLQEQLREAEDSQKSMSPGDIEVPTAKLPAATLDYIRKYREVKLHEGLYEALTKQFEAAKLDEAKTAPMIQVVDRAIPAEKKSGPFRSLIILGAGLASLFLASMWCMISFGFSQATQSDETTMKIKLLRSHLSWWNKRDV